jgi:hypothetical protein
MAIEYDAADQQTMEAAQMASVRPTEPTPPRKAQARRSSGVRPSEIRKTRWKRFKYELGLKMKSTCRGKGRNRREWAQVGDVELDEVQSERGTV